MRHGKIQHICKKISLIILTTTFNDGERTKEKYVDIRPIPFENDDSINAQLDNTGKSLVALQTKYSLHYVVYLISEAKSSTTFNLLMSLKKNR